ncbi:hypothetical protein CNR22_02730 [Sphingobacteriaceae bacterium]|nr:hypothetical protein CNR22_02730 [Sphingobacteriaceae bacterium]
MRLFTFLILFSCLISACSTGKKFTSRKYTSGRYVTYAKHKERVSRSASENEKIAKAAERSETATAQVSSNSQIVEPQALSHSVVTQAKRSDLSLSPVPGKTKVLPGKSKTVLSLNKEKSSVSSKMVASSDGKSSKSLLSVFLGAGGLTLEVVGFILTVISAEYLFMTLIAAGLALGIIALVMGIMGIKQYKEDKRNGQKKRSTLILGIIGTALGGAAIFFALYFSVLSLIFVESGI